MSIGSNMNEFALEEAIKSYLDEKQETKLPVLLGSDFNELVYPCVFIEQITSIEPPEMHNTATMEVILDIGILTEAGVSRAKHVEYVVGIMDLIFNDDFRDELNASRVDGLGVQRIGRLERQTTIDGDRGVRETRQRLQILTDMNR